MNNSTNQSNNLINQKFGALVVKDYYNQSQVICQCICGSKVILDINELYKDRRKTLSCGCAITKRDLPNLYKLYSRMSEKEKLNWGTWNDFIKWSKSLGYCEIFSYIKINKRKPYSKDNLLFGLYINKEFFSIQCLQNKKYFYDESLKKFVTNKKIKNLNVTNDEITRALNKQKSKHKTLPDNLFKKLKVSNN